MKKIYILTSNISEIGGVQKITINLANQLSNEYEIIIVNAGRNTGEKFFELNSKIKIEYLEVYFKKNRNPLEVIKNMVEVFFKLKKFLKIHTDKNEKKILIGMGIGFSYIISLLKFKNIKKIGSQHGGYKNNIILNKIRLNLLKRLDYFIVLNPEMYEENIKNFGLTNIKLIPNFILDDEYSIKKERKDLKVALAIGRFCEDKGFDYLIDIWENIVKEKPYFKLKIVGSGELEQEIIKKIKIKKLEESIKVFPATSNIKKYYEEADVYLLTSRREGFGMVLLEAMASKLPIVSFNCPTGPKLLIKNNYNGYLVECFDKKEFARKTIFLLSNQKNYRRMSENAFLISKLYSASKIIKQWKKIIDE